MAVAGGLVGDRLGDVQAGEREVGSGLFQGHVRGVVRAGEESAPARASRCTLTDSVAGTDW